MSADRHLPAGPTLQIQHRTYWYVSKVVKGEFTNNKQPLPVIPPVVVQQMRSSTPQVVQPDHAEVTTPTEIESDDDADRTKRLLCESISTGRSLHHIGFRRPAD